LHLVFVRDAATRSRDVVVCKIRIGSGRGLELVGSEHVDLLGGGGVGLLTQRNRTFAPVAGRVLLVGPALSIFRMLSLVLVCVRVILVG